MRCPACGSESPVGVRFCGKCGAALGGRVCPSCHADAGPTERFCSKCGSALGGASAGGGSPAETPHGSRTAASSGLGETPIPRAREASDPPRRGGCGCPGCGCQTFLLLLVVLLLVGGVWAARHYRVLERIGLARPASEQLMSQTPDREAAAAIIEELAKGGFSAGGMTIYVMPVAGRESSVAVAVLEASKGFTFKRAGARDPITDFLTRLVATEGARNARVERVAVEYRDWMGQSLLTLTAPTDAISAFARGAITRQQFIEKLEGNANWPAFYAEVLQ